MLHHEHEVYQQLRGFWRSTYASAGTSIVDSEFSYNLALSTSGHGGALDLSSSPTSIENTRFIGNQTAGGQSAIYQGGGSLRIVNSLFAGNITTGTSSTLGIYGNATILHSTIAQPISGADNALSVGSGTVGISDTIIASYTGWDRQVFRRRIREPQPVLWQRAQHDRHDHQQRRSLRQSALVNPAAGDYHLRPARPPSMRASLWASGVTSTTRTDRSAPSI